MEQQNHRIESAMDAERWWTVAANEQAVRWCDEWKCSCAIQVLTESLV